jgi:hypothetical protein
MPSRRSHEKSHHGCVTCKRRRVKVSLTSPSCGTLAFANANMSYAVQCDETRPKCANCTRRGTECIYLSGYVSTTPDSSNAGNAFTPENLPNTYLEQVLDSRASQV